MIQIRIDIHENKKGQVFVESRVGLDKKSGPTRAEAQVAAKVKDVVELTMDEIAKTLPGSAIAKTEEDVELMKGLEGLDL